MKLSLSRRYLFSASHRLHSDQLDEAENRRVYGKCNNPYGHGHNYVVEVTVTGPVDPATGMIANLADLDPYVNEHVLEVFDHKFLNEEIPRISRAGAHHRKPVHRNFSPLERVSDGPVAACARRRDRAQQFRIR